ncbi:MAG TPA: MdtA/MuxA family multidrug efflux RND transporter periplasmic adaptor subunit [Candidatus Acidoferrales bacterium]|nr:MdtA/MuxA family multidrug efflux RND transporter periplasmic adaptor subunit [Candidatus Acidoferrales bacterium]
MASPTIEERQKSETLAETKSIQSTPRGKSREWVWILILLVLGYGGWHYRSYFTGAPAASSNGTGSGRGGGGAIPVAVAAAVRGDVPVYFRNIGTVTAFNTVTVHTRVDGQLDSVAFTEGQFVHAGDVLAEIDPRPYQVQLEQAQGQLAHDLALQKDALVNAARDATLAKEGVISQQTADTQQAQVGQYDGAIKTDQGAIDSARLNLTYSKITAPISGRIGLRQVDAGNIVHAGDANGLVVITQLQPIAVLFSLPENNLLAVNKKLAAGLHPVAEAYDADNTLRLSTGTLATIDNLIDSSTGTFKLKAVFNNEDNKLFPNQLVYIRLLVDSMTGLTIVPAAAIQRGPQGTFVFLVAPGNTVTVRNVTVAITEGDQVGTTAGLQPGDLVVTDGQDKLQEGSKVDTHTASPSGTSTQSVVPNAPPSSAPGNPPGAVPKAKSRKP